MFYLPPLYYSAIGLLRMVDICFYFECKGNVFWEGMQSSFWFIFMLWGGGFYAHPFFSRRGRLVVAAGMLVHTVMSAGNTQKKRELS